MSGNNENFNNYIADMNIINRSKLQGFFEESVSNFFVNEKDNILTGVSERNLCGRLAHHMECLKSKYELQDYFADTEYNRKQDGKIKTIINADLKIVSITCDIILHSRGTKVKADNLIAIEMKKADRPDYEKENDKNRLKALTKETYDDIWSYDGKTLPKHVCGYILGVFIEVDEIRRVCHIKYYYKGHKKYGCKMNF